MQEEHSIAALCDALAVSRSGYHAWAARTPGLRAQANATLWPFIEQAYQESRQTYGSPRIRQWLGRRGQKCSRHRVARLMRGHRMASQTKRRFRVQLTDSNHDLPIAPNRLRDMVRPADATRSGWPTSPTWTRTKAGSTSSLKNSIIGVWLHFALLRFRFTRGWARHFCSGRGAFARAARHPAPVSGRALARRSRGRPIRTRRDAVPAIQSCRHTRRRPPISFLHPLHSTCRSARAATWGARPCCRQKLTNSRLS